MTAQDIPADVAEKARDLLAYVSVNRNEDDARSIALALLAERREAEQRGEARILKTVARLSGHQWSEQVDKAADQERKANHA